ncbi:MAG: PilZ domain-containing protein [Candidatus Omnitrophica bacterium]|nr:PilZ domain-containing protein [Candidatus Omnitrophota bacterium]
MSVRVLQGAERRRHVRLEQLIPFKISSGDLDFVTETKNFSSSGALCLVNKHITPMTKLKLHFLLPLKRNNKVVNKRISCEGVVVRSESAVDQDSFQTAIFFSDISPRDSQIIHEFVESAMPPHESISKSL